MLSDLVKKPKTEPKLIACFRYFVIVVSILVLFLFAIVLFMKLGDERPNITSSFEAADSLPAPVIYFSNISNFTINCYIDGNRSKNCNEYVTQPENLPGNPGDDGRRTFFGKFTPRENINLTPYSGSGTYFVSLSITVDPANVEGTIAMHIFDSEFDPWSEDFNGTVDPFVESLSYTNLYYLTNKMYYIFGYSRKFRNKIVDTASNYVGFRSIYTTQKYIESQMQIVGTDMPEYSLIEVLGNNFNIEVEKEQRINTIIYIFGTIGGYYGVIATFYIFLFGADIIQPWGFVHNGCCIFGRLKKKTEDKVKKEIEGKHLSIAIYDTNEKEDYSKRLRDLEAFRSLLEKNFIDISLTSPKEQKKK